MKASADPYIVVIRSGPMWRLEDQLGHLAEAFGSRYEGEILTWATTPDTLTRGGFRVTRVAIPYEKPLWARVRYVLTLLRRALRIRWMEGRRLVVITYDPFQSGIAGLLMKWLAGARFICEVNGVYGHPLALVDMDDPRLEERRRRRMLRFGSRILRRADAIKLLYPEQLVGFSLDGDEPRRQAFHDLVNGPRFEPTGRRPEKVILLVGYPYRLKGVDLLLEAFTRLSSEFPDWRLELVGWQLEENADVDYPADRVSFPGPQPHGELCRTMERAAIFVLPSRCEAMGRVLLEAAFMGRPRIGSRAGGIPRVVDHGVDGLLFDAEDVGGLEDALRTLMTDPEMRARMGEAARRRALEEFSRERYMERYEGLIDSVLRGSPPTAAS